MFLLLFLFTVVTLFTRAESTHLEETGDKLLQKLKKGWKFYDSDFYLERLFGFW